MTNTKKITKREYLNTLRAIVENGDFDFENPEMTVDGMLEFIDHEVELLDNKAAAAAKRAAAKREAGDELRARIVELLDTENYMTINEIVKALGDEDVSAQMVTSRLTQACKAELVEKDMVSTEVAGKTKKLSAYRRIG